MFKSRIIAFDDEKFKISSQVKEKFDNYTIKYIEDFLAYFGYEFLSNDFMGVFFVDDDFYDKKNGFGFSLMETGENILHFQFRYFLVISAPEQVLSDFEKFLDLGPFYDGKITKDI